MASKEVEELIRTRADALTEAYHSANVDTMMDWYSKDVNFSDHAMQATNLDSSSLRTFLGSLYSQTSGMKLGNINLNSTSPALVAMEMDLDFTLTVDSKELRKTKGEEVKMRGVALQHWREEDEDKGGKTWRIVKEADYFFVVDK